MRIVTWNIQWGRGVDGRVDLERIVRVARATADFDVLCLQEVAIHCTGLAGSCGEDQVAMLQALLPGYEGYYGIGADIPHSRRGRSVFGNLVLSRLPVLQVFRHLLPWPPDPAVPSMQRVMVEAVVRASWGPLRVQTTHLEYYSPAQRMAQVDALRALHAQACAHALSPRPEGGHDQPFAATPRPASAVLCGDLNFQPDDPEHARLTAAIDHGRPRFVDAWEALHPQQPHPDTVGLHGAEWPDHPFCCDFFLVTEDLVPRLRRVEVNAEPDASDHQPMLLELAD
ncbi:MAG: endonuclease/exonuclease/phosphatase family protein [Betaproteobacteria bacterium]|nr:endonuclease/exonuclease/phosphatase family protein [Betaproteobacteria bacterium]